MDLCARHETGNRLAFCLPGTPDTGIATTTQLTVFYRFFPCSMDQIADRPIGRGGDDEDGGGRGIREVLSHPYLFSMDDEDFNDAIDRALYHAG